jgi:hypothetical protein
MLYPLKPNHGITCGRLSQSGNAVVRNGRYVINGTPIDIDMTTTDNTERHSSGIGLEERYEESSRFSLVGGVR